MPPQGRGLTLPDPVTALEKRSNFLEKYIYEAAECHRLEFICLCSGLDQLCLRTGPNANNKAMKAPLRPSH